EAVTTPKHAPRWQPRPLVGESTLHSIHASPAPALVGGEPRQNGPVTVVIAGPAVAKGRPRVTRRGFVYTPAATRKYEAHGRPAAQQAMDGRPPITVPVRAEIIINLPVP